MENTILDLGAVLAIVAVAAVYIFRRFFKNKDRGTGCGCSCDSCPSAGDGIKDSPCSPPK